MAFRALHSAVHCTFNPVMLRFYLYLIAALEVWFMVVRAGLAHFGGQRAFDDLRTGRITGGAVATAP